MSFCLVLTAPVLILISCSMVILKYLFTVVAVFYRSLLCVNCLGVEESFNTQIDIGNFLFIQKLQLIVLGMYIIDIINKFIINVWILKYPSHLLKALLFQSNSYILGCLVLAHVRRICSLSPASLALSPRTKPFRLQYVDVYSLSPQSSHLFC